jgi:hypothetical protein
VVEGVGDGVSGWFDDGWRGALVGGSDFDALAWADAVDVGEVGGDVDAGDAEGLLAAVAECEAVGRGRLAAEAGHADAFLGPCWPQEVDEAGQGLGLFFA